MPSTVTGGTARRAPPPAGSRFAFGVVAAITVAVMTGWWADLDALTRWGGDGVSTPWSALGILAAAAASVLPTDRARLAAGAAIGAALFGLAAPDLAADLQRAVSRRPDFISSPGTLATMLLLGSGGLLLRRRWWPILFAVGAVAVAHLTVLAHLLNLPWLATAGATSPLAGLSLPTATAAIAAAAAIGLRAEAIGHLEAPLTRHTVLRRARTISLALFTAGVLGVAMARTFDSGGGEQAYLAVAALAVVVAIVGTVVALDIERREAGQALEAMVDASPDATLFVDPEGLVVRANAQAEVLFGWSRGDLVGRCVDDLVPDGDRAAHAGHREDYARAPASRPMEGRQVEARHADGHTFPVEVALSPIRLDARTLFAATVRDATAHRRQLDRLQELEAMQDLLLSAVSHEVRTPLAVAQGLARTLANRLDELAPEVREELVDGVIRNIDRLAALLEDLLDVEALRRNERHVDPVPTDLSGVVTDTVGRWRGPTDRMVTDRVEPGCWALAVPGTIPRLVENLLSNADAYAPLGPVEVTLRPSNDGVLLIVEDHGRGVPVELRRTVFRPFQRGPQVRSDSPGTGLGLTVVDMLARMAGGEAWVTDRSNGQPGASFRVRLPHAEPPPADVAAAAPGALARG